MYRPPNYITFVIWIHEYLCTWKHGIRLSIPRLTGVTDICFALLILIVQNIWMCVTKVLLPFSEQKSVIHMLRKYKGGQSTLSFRGFKDFWP
jgi:hypothetical protein